MRPLVLALPLAVALVACRSEPAAGPAMAGPPPTAAKPAEQKEERKAEEKPGAARPDAEGVVRVQATQEGFEPSRIEAPEGKPLKLIFTRPIERTCMTGVVFPDLGIEKDLPLNEPVTVEVTPKAGSPIRFECPMGMGKSTIVATPAS